MEITEETTKFGRYLTGAGLAGFMIDLVRDVNGCEAKISKFDPIRECDWMRESTNGTSPSPLLTAFQAMEADRVAGCDSQGEFLEGTSNTYVGDLSIGVIQVEQHPNTDEKRI